MNRVTSFVKELACGEINLSESYVTSLQLKYAKQIQPIVENIKNDIQKSKVIHFDETSINIDGKHATIQGYADTKNTYLLATNKKCDEHILDFFKYVNC
ncbi:hypothetical protein FACS1894166_13220 [Bacilli bacterium]|nr:hypothetical protein FACS1894166_13220 [Bacilli bacterium]